ncbi:MAG TPA: hypothetical protein VH208_11645 [Myxococcaceae bacterium]|nr:hypothetical protein [Myxococcaceae bacterium]
MIRVARHLADPITEAELQELYAEIPTVACRGLCQDYCASISMSGTEFDLICEELGWTPRTAPGCATCPVLGPDGRCRAYIRRPVICRLWGATKTMQCPHGCEPSPRYLTEEEAFILLLRSGGVGPPLPRAEAEAMAAAVFSRRRRIRLR